MGSPLGQLEKLSKLISEQKIQNPPYEVNKIQTLWGHITSSSKRCASSKPALNKNKAMFSSNTNNSDPKHKSRTSSSQAPTRCSGAGDELGPPQWDMGTEHYNGKLETKFSALTKQQGYFKMLLLQLYLHLAALTPFSYSLEPWGGT